MTALPEGPWRRAVRLARRHRVALLLLLAYLLARAVLFAVGRR